MHSKSTEKKSWKNCSQNCSYTTHSKSTEKKSCKNCSQRAAVTLNLFCSCSASCSLTAKTRLASTPFFLEIRHQNVRSHEKKECKAFFFRVSWCYLFCSPNNRLQLEKNSSLGCFRRSYNLLGMSKKKKQQNKKSEEFLLFERSYAQIALFTITSKFPFIPEAFIAFKLSEFKRLQLLS